MLLFLTIILLSSCEEYKKCKDMRFCYQNIDKVDDWSLNNANFDSELNLFSAKIIKQNNNDNLDLLIYLVQNNSFRIQIIPTNKENFSRYKISGSSFVVNQEIINQHLPLSFNNESEKLILSSDDCKAEIHLNPFYISISDKYNSILYINFNQKLVFEHKGEKVISDNWPYYLNDTIKNGATATGIDFSFHGKNTRISGFSQFSDDSINIEDTDEDPIRLNNLGSFSNYGHVPLIHGHSSKEMVSFLWLNPSDTFLKISTDNNRDLRNVRLISEGGLVDIVVFTGKILEILNSYTKLTGNHEIPPIFSIGYHHSKSGSSTQNEVERIIDEYDNRRFPIDALWLNSDHLYKNQPFRFNLSSFPDPSSLFQKLSGHNRFLIRLNNPYVPEDDTHLQYKYAKEHGYFVNMSDGKTPFKSTTLAGSSFWPDFSNPEVHKWWSTLYKYQTNETASNVYFWIDTNEPTMYSTIDGTFPKDNVHYGGYEDREIHNIFGLMVASSVHEGVINRNKDKNVRPFIVSRSFYAGSQKYSFIWNGENKAKFNHLRRSISQSILSGLCGLPLAGSDIGGFIGEGTSQLILRWYQAAVFGYPLFSSHHELFDDSKFDQLLNLTKYRYKASLVWYTSIQSSHETGIPPVLPLFALYQEIESLHDVYDQFILGQSLMVAPVLEENATKRRVIKPPGIWYDINNGQKLMVNSSKSFITIDVNESSLPVFIKGGSIIPLFKDVGKNMDETMKSPIKLIVGCDENGNANGSFYMDDGISFNYEKGEFLNRLITFENNQIKIKNREPIEKVIPSIVNNLYINEITFYGLKNKPEKVGDESILVCLDNTSCTLKNLKLFLRNIDDERNNDNKKLNKKTLYIIIICCSCVGFIAVAIAIACIVICHLDPKKDDELKIESILIDNNL